MFELETDKWLIYTHKENNTSKKKMQYNKINSLQLHIDFKTS